MDWPYLKENVRLGQTLRKELNELIRRHIVRIEIMKPFTEHYKNGFLNHTNKQKVKFSLRSGKKYCPQTMRKFLRGDDCSDAVQGECLLPGGLAACCWLKV
jgi:hypothetical protein